MKTEVVMFAGQKVYKAIRAAVKYLRDEATGYYHLLDPVDIAVSGANCGGVNFDNGVFHVVSPDKNNVVFHVAPFAAASKYWNGPSVVKDYNDGRIEASLIHDLIWTWDKQIAEENGMTVSEVHEWSNKHLGAMWREYAHAKPVSDRASHIKSWFAANVCNCWLSRVWRRIVCLFFVSLIGGCSGCINVPDWEVNPGAVHFEGPTK
jgi:hypothetical protein